ncbi:MAG: hypothetical protein ACRDJH_23960 [Thermomicrobiales bacterium]
MSTDGGRLDAVPILTTIAEAGELIMINVLPATTDRASPVIGVWSRFVPLQLRLGALASGPREGLAAEIALAFRPALVVLAGEVRGIAVAVATVDQVAAELFGLAFAAVGRDELDPATAIGPWEDPLVQRATELGLGVAMPSEIIVRSSWLGLAGDDRDVFEELLGGVTSALDIAGQFPDP